MNWTEGAAMSELRYRLAKKLAAHGIKVHWYDFRPAQGFHRSDPRSDNVRWTAWAVVDGTVCEIASWDTMTACAAREGLSVEKNSRRTMSGFVEVFANKNG